MLRATEIRLKNENRCSSPVHVRLIRFFLFSFRLGFARAGSQTCTKIDFRMFYAGENSQVLRNNVVWDFGASEAPSAIAAGSRSKCHFENSRRAPVFPLRSGMTRRGAIKVNDEYCCVDMNIHCRHVAAKLTAGAASIRESTRFRWNWKSSI